MLLAYLDEFGHVGPYIGPDHRKFWHHPIFGYAGFVIPSDRVRLFGSAFAYRKERQFRAEIVASGAMAARWEKKGSEIFTTGSFQRYPENVDMIEALSRYLRSLGGAPFFYGQVKPLGTERSSGETSLERSSHVLRQAVTWLSRFADQRDEDILIMVDSITPKTRLAIAHDVASYIYSSSESSLKRVVDIPVELDSKLYSSIQFADWLCASATRATHFHFVPGSEFGWAPATFQRLFDRGVNESRIWMRERNEKVYVKALGHSKPWHEMFTPAREPRTPASRKRTHGGK
jgi:hypothetical protein